MSAVFRFPGFYISAASIIGSTGLIFAFRKLPWYLGRENDVEKLWLVPGLQNLGNNCFLNVVVQALASCSYFRSFLKTSLEGFGASTDDEPLSIRPLSAALNDLLEGLCTVRHSKEVLSPRKVMSAIVHCIPHFDLACQQDAEEALFHIWSSIREESSHSFFLRRNSLADVVVLSDCCNLDPKKKMICDDLERWAWSFFGPFDGIVGSVINCKSCLSQISLDFQVFHCLYLSPVLVGEQTLGCSLEDCLKQFFLAEQLENYSCSQCWHTAAEKYLSLIGGNQTDVEKLRCCMKEDSCECKNVLLLRSLPWSNSFSHIFKQLYVSRGPKILCLYLKRASVNSFGESVKLQGHVSFPLALDLSPYLNHGIDLKNWTETLPVRQSSNPNQWTLHLSDYLSVKRDAKILNCISRKSGLTSTSDEQATEKWRKLQNGVENFIPAVQEERGLSVNGCSSATVSYATTMNPGDKEQLGRALNSDTSELCKYRLVSVVEHLGVSGSGHYTVYRRVENDLLAYAELSAAAYWFRASDSQVARVCETHVLAAEASLLFYERISQS